MTTACVDCMVSTGVGEMRGRVGLPSLDDAPRGRGKHPLSKTLSSGGDADTDETFGYLASGLRALGLAIHSWDQYWAFLERHRPHRLFERSGFEDDEELPSELHGPDDKAKFEDYKPPRKSDGYVRARLVFDCPKCEDRFHSDSSDWVKPFDPRVLTADQVKEFHGRLGVPAEYCVHEAEPFEILLMDLDEWLTEHKSHKVVMRLENSTERWACFDSA